jgi:hypothetical protein
VTRAALIVFFACACVKGSSKDDHASPMAPGRSETPAATQATAPGSVAERPSASPAAAPAGARSSTALRIDSVASARAAIGKRVRLEGTADNAKLGAVVVKGDLVVYCVDRKDGWDQRNLPVIVEGVLDHTSRARARTGSDGSISAGTGDPIFEMTCDVVR